MSSLIRTDIIPLVGTCVLVSAPAELTAKNSENNHKLHAVCVSTLKTSSSLGRKLCLVRNCHFYKGVKIHINEYNSHLIAVRRQRC